MEQSAAEGDVAQGLVVQPPRARPHSRQSDGNRDLGARLRERVGQPCEQIAILNFLPHHIFITESKRAGPDHRRTTQRCVPRECEEAQCQPHQMTLQTELSLSAFDPCKDRSCIVLDRDGGEAHLLPSVNESVATSCCPLRATEAAAHTERVALRTKPVSARSSPVTLQKKCGCTCVMDFPEYTGESQPPSAQISHTSTISGNRRDRGLGILTAC